MYNTKKNASDVTGKIERQLAVRKSQMENMNKKNIKQTKAH